MAEEQVGRDRQWCERIDAGDIAALESVYDAYAGAVYRQAMAVLGSAADAEDVVQEVFLHMVRRRGGPIRDLKAYLLTAARRQSFSTLRRRRQEELAAGVEASPPTPVGSPSTLAEGEVLRQALQALPSPQRDVVVLKVYEQLTFEEIGRVVRASANTVASRYRYALQKLRQALEIRAMFEEPTGTAGQELFSNPSPELRERVLRSCREAMAERQATAAPHGERAWRYCWRSWTELRVRVTAGVRKNSAWRAAMRNSSALRQFCETRIWERTYLPPVSKRQRWWRWNLASGAACLLLFNAMAEQRHAARTGALVAGDARVARGPSPRPSPAALKLIRARSVLLAALLRDPDAL